MDKENIEVARPDDMSPEDFKNCIKLMRNLSLLREKDNKIYLDKFCFANSSVS
ncbi:MAG: hypothetical protein K2H64_06310 [Desulfovibrio sp.]|nr:hypothetical protein [Desulfovibrio sp.]